MRSSSMRAYRPASLRWVIPLLFLGVTLDGTPFAAEQNAGPPPADAKPQRARRPDEAEHAIFGVVDHYIVAGRVPPTRLINLWFDTQPVEPSSHLWQLCQPLGALRFAEDGTPAGLPEMLRDHCFQSNPRLGWLREATNPNKPSAAVFLTQMFGKRNVPDAEWSRITSLASAAKPHLLDRDPRVAENWFAALESGRQHDDYRFRRAAYVQVGQGYRTTHTSSMDLSIVAHGLPMALDVQRGVGSTRWVPKYGLLQIHNGIEVNGDGGYGPKDEKGRDVLEQVVCQWSWIHTLADVEGARFLSARTIPPPWTTVAMRQVALIDVDEGQGSQPLAPEQRRVGAKLPPGAKTANSYVFDVDRAAGGSLHTYCFHGPVDDAFTSNAQNEMPIEPYEDDPELSGQSRKLTTGQPSGDQREREAQKAGLREKIAHRKNGFTLDQQYFYTFGQSEGETFAGDTPAQYEATWRYSRSDRQGSEQEYLGVNFDPDSPRKYTRLHLLDMAGGRVLRGKVVATKAAHYEFTNVMAQKRGADLQSAFTAIVEPYAGEPFLQSIKPLTIEGNDTDALRAVAVEVKTTSGRTDLCFADGRGGKLRTVTGAAFPFEAAGEFAFYSRDAQGLSQASLAGGTSLAGPELRLRATRAEYTAAIRRIDYAANTLVIDRPWPRVCTGNVLQAGVPNCTTTYSVVDLAAVADGTQLTLDRSANFYRAQFYSLLPKGTMVRDHSDDRGGELAHDAVETRFGCFLSEVPSNLLRARTFTASNATRTRWWKAGNKRGTVVELIGPPATPADFAPSGELLLWDYDAGDTVRQSTFASVRRVEPGIWEVTGNVDLEITLMGHPPQNITTDQLSRGPVKIHHTP